MTNSIDETIQRTKRYWYVDGLNEMATGSILLLVAGLYWLLDRFSGPLSALGVGLGVPLIILAGGRLMSRVVRALKERITYPRTGYVTYRRPQHGRRRALIVMGVSAAISALLIVLVLPYLNRSWMTVFISAFAAFFMGYLGYQIGMLRFYLMGAASLALGVAAALLPISDLMQIAAYLGGFGVAWIVSGGTTLWRYLLQTRPLAEGEQS